MADNICTVKSKNGGKYIDGVPMLKWGEWRDCTYAGAMALLYQAAGIKTSYEQIMGWSGACYRITMADNWDPSSEMLQVSVNCEKNAELALGTAVYSLEDEKLRDKQVQKSIDIGIPVMACGQRGAPEWTVITGYEKSNGKVKYFGRTYFDYEKPNENDIFTENRYFYADCYPGEFPQALLRLYDKPCEPITKKEALKVSLETCIKMFKQTGNYKYGYDAYDVLIHGFELEDKVYKQRCGCDQYHIGSLMDARRSATIFINKNVILLSGDQKQKLITVAELYKKMLDLLLQVLPYEKTSSVFNAYSDPVWDKTTRQNLADALREAAELEKRVRITVKDILENWED